MTILSAFNSLIILVECVEYRRVVEGVVAKNTKDMMKKLGKRGVKKIDLTDVDDDLKPVVEELVEGEIAPEIVEAPEISPKMKERSK